MEKRGEETQTSVRRDLRMRWMSSGPSEEALTIISDPSNVISDDKVSSPKSISVLGPEQSLL